VLDRSLATSLPKKPGVYIMRDAHDEIVYIGKSKNLRSRVSSYYSQPIGMTRKMDGLVENVTRIDHVVVGSEIDALILESQFIRRYQPRYNTALKRSEFYPYIKVDVTNPWPRVRLVRSKKDDGARYFGPYTSATSARKTVDVINSALPLRTCTRSFANARSYGKPCIALDLKQCLGPCTGKVDRGKYLQHVHTVLNLLDGADDGMYQQLHRQLEDAAEKLDFERADRIRKSILNLTAVLGEQKRTRDAESLHNLLLVLPGIDENHRDLWLVIHGRLWARFEVDTGAEGIEDELTARLASSLERARVAKMPPKDHHEVDESGILNRFLFRNEGSDAMVLLSLDEQGTVIDDAATLVRRILAVGGDAIAALDVKKVIFPDTDPDAVALEEDFA
jgi:excinuclease UvrABC nuclease subunit